MFFLVILFCFVSVSQSVYTIKITDDVSGEGIDSCVLEHQGLRFYTNAMGYQQFEASTGDTLLIFKKKYVAETILLPEQKVFSYGLKSYSVIDSLKFNDFYIKMANRLRYPRMALKYRWSDLVIALMSWDNSGVLHYEPISDSRDIFNREIYNKLSALDLLELPFKAGEKYLIDVRFCIGSKTFEPNIPDEILERYPIIPEIRIVLQSEERIR